MSLSSECQQMGNEDLKTETLPKIHLCTILMHKSEFPIDGTKMNSTICVVLRPLLDWCVRQQLPMLSPGNIQACAFYTDDFIFMS